MKFRYLLSIVLASSILFAGCSKDESTASFDNLKLDQTYLIAGEDGGTLTLTVTSTEEWKFVVNETWPVEISLDKNAKAEYDRFGNLLNPESDYYKTSPSWLTADKMGGDAGETKVTFTVPASKAGRELEIALYAGNNKQFLRVRQGSLAPVEKTCKEIKESANVGSSYITSGNVSRLGNYASYGAFWIIDETGEEVQVYGSTKESREKYPNVEVGDYVKFSGVWSSYKNFENAEISKHVKSLVKVVTESEPMPVAGGELAVTVAYKGNGVFPTIKEACAEWITFASMEYKAGVPSKLEPSPADTAVVKFNVAENTSGPRTGEITFASYKDKDNSAVTYTFKQLANSLYSETFNAGQGDFTITNVTLPEGSDYVWKHSTYDGAGYMKASAYVNKANRASESLLVSPEIDLKDVETATLTFEHALANLYSGNKLEHIFLLVKKSGDAEWTNVAIPEMDKIEGKSYDWFPSGNIDLSSYKGKKVQFAFKYVSTTSCAPTWQIRNVMVK